MSNPAAPEPSQVGMGALAAHPAAPAVAAAVCLLLALLMPMVSVAVNLGGMVVGGASLAGSTLFGVYGWLAVFLLLGAVATHLVWAASPYRSIAAIAALAAWAGLAAYAAYQAFNPLPPEAAAAMQGMGNLFGGGPARPGQPGFGAQARQAVQQAVSVTPGIGLLPFVAAGALLILGLIRGRRATAS